MAFAQEVAIWLDDSAPLPKCTGDVTPGRCQRFGAQPGQRPSWSNALEEESRPVASGAVAADERGLVTIGQLLLGKEKHRTAIRWK